MTVFSMTIKTARENFDDPEKYYPYAESGSHQMLLQVWDKVVDQLRVPRKNLLILANSAGSVMVQRFALLNADRVDAVSMIGGWHYEPMLKPNAIAWSVLCTRGDIREEANVELAEQARALGVNMLHTTTPICALKKADFTKQYTDTSFHHTASISGYDIAQQFLAAVRDMRNADKNWRNTALWPLRAPADYPWAVEKSGADSLPLTEATCLPSEAFAAAWLRNENRSVVVPSADGGSRAAFIRYPQAENPKGVIIYGGGAAERSDRGDDIDFLSMQGFIVVGTPEEIGGNLEDARALLNWVSSLEQWKSYPIFLLGFNEAGRHFLSLLPETERVRSAAAIDARLPSVQAVLPKTDQQIYLSSLDSDGGDQEAFQPYLKEATAAGASVSVISPDRSSALLRFDILEEIATRFSQP